MAHMTACEEQAVQERGMARFRIDQSDSHENIFNTAAGARLP
ncbi:hypothetical protein [Burkholderia contaminans]|nr:hypothetical protein [Burkholderia contaminans]